ncbi:MAG TPA: hypothetical protein VGL05_15535 [Kribbella sp.]
MDWNDLKHGDRVRHFEYGAGTVHSSGPIWLFITWDRPNGYYYHWTTAIARYLTRLTPTEAARPQDAASDACGR